jgi:hypothetical protein
MDEDINNDFVEAYGDIANAFEDIGNLIAQLMFSAIYDKVDKYPQINRDFARILCNLVIISGIIIKYIKTNNQEKIKEYENELKKEVDEFNENVNGFSKCFENKDNIDVSVWNYTVKHYFNYMSLLPDKINIMKDELNEKFKTEYEKFKELNNKIYEIIGKYKQGKINNIEYMK